MAKIGYDSQLPDNAHIYWKTGSPDKSETSSIYLQSRSDQLKYDRQRIAEMNKKTFGERIMGNIPFSGLYELPTFVIILFFIIMFPMVNFFINNKTTFLPNDQVYKEIDNLAQFRTYTVYLNIPTLTLDLSDPVSICESHLGNPFDNDECNAIYPIYNQYFGLSSGLSQVPMLNRTFYAYNLDKEIEFYNKEGYFKLKNYNYLTVNNYNSVGSQFQSGLNGVTGMISLASDTINTMKDLADLFNPMLDTTMQNPNDASYIYNNPDMTWWEKLMWSIGNTGNRSGGY